MMMLPLRSLALLCILPVLAACGTTPPSRFYLLAPVESPAATPALAGEPHIGIGPIGFPEYLDRPQIVTRTGNAEIHLAETERWAEPLQENFTRVLTENLSRRLGTGRISIEPSRNRDALDLRVVVDVLQFDSTTGGEVVLLAYWNIQDRDGKRLAATEKSEIRLPGVPDATPAESVERLSAAVAELGRLIAGKLAGLAATDTPDKGL